MSDNDNEWLWEVEDEPASGGLIDRAAERRRPTRRRSSPRPPSRHSSLHLAKRSDDAIKELAKAVEKGEHLDEVYAILGQVQFERGKYKEAADAFGKLMDVEPRHRTGYYNLGVCLYRAGDRPAAALAFERAVNANSDRPEARLGWALCRLDAGQYDHALDLFTKYIAVRREPSVGAARQGHLPAEDGQDRRRRWMPTAASFRRMRMPRTPCRTWWPSASKAGTSSWSANSPSGWPRLKPQARVALEGLAAISHRATANGTRPRGLSTNSTKSRARRMGSSGTTSASPARRLGRRDDAIKAFTREREARTEVGRRARGTRGRAAAEGRRGRGAQSLRERPADLRPATSPASGTWRCSPRPGRIGKRQPSCFPKPSANRRTGPTPGSVSGYVQLRAKEFKGSIEAFEKCLQAEAGLAGGEREPRQPRCWAPGTEDGGARAARKAAAGQDERRPAARPDRI